MECKYGCGQEAKTQLKGGGWICGYYSAQCPVNKQKNSKIIKGLHNSGVLKSDHLKSPDKISWNKGKTFIPDSELFKKDCTYNRWYIRKIIISKQIIPYQCNICQIHEWNSHEISLELDHINGINNDNRICNLRFLCPNCHSQTHTFRGRNINNGKSKATDEELLNALRLNNFNIYKSLKSLGMSGGSNYIRVKKIINSFSMSQ